jgi:hypothetical protein
LVKSSVMRALDWPKKAWSRSPFPVRVRKCPLMATSWRTAIPQRSSVWLSSNVNGPLSKTVACAGATAAVTSMVVSTAGIAT